MGQDWHSSTVHRHRCLGVVKCCWAHGQLTGSADEYGLKNSEHLFFCNLQFPLTLAFKAFPSERKTLFALASSWEFGMGLHP